MRIKKFENYCVLRINDIIYLKLQMLLWLEIVQKLQHAKYIYVVRSLSHYHF